MLFTEDEQEIYYTQMEIAELDELQKDIENSSKYFNDEDSEELFRSIYSRVEDMCLPYDKHVPRRSYTHAGFAKDREHRARYDLMDIATKRKMLVKKIEQINLDYWIWGTKDTKYRNKITRDTSSFKECILEKAVKVLGKKKIVDIEEIKEDIEILKEIEDEEYETYQKEIEYEDSLLIDEESAAY
jgi:hypothetical protein